MGIYSWTCSSRTASQVTADVGGDEYIVVKPFKVEESRSMPWFGQSGMRIQYETFNGAKMPVAELAKQGYLVTVMP
ncbi:glycohydrolase toxin TNT-related protein [Hydrogenophaga sp.]|uniref:glycohydrolase toxin TNT-related protein n=1 Tax=Hydrogenophaga sp. TaxID=1904254 RepID=UPI0039C87573